MWNHVQDKFVGPVEDFKDTSAVEILVVGKELLA